MKTAQPTTELTPRQKMEAAWNTHCELSAAAAQAQRDFWRLGQEMADIEGPKHFFKIGERIYDTSQRGGFQRRYCAGYEFLPRTEENYPEQRSLGLRFISLKEDREPTPEDFQEHPYMIKYGWAKTYVNEEGWKAHCHAEAEELRARVLARRAKEAQNG